MNELHSTKSQVIGDAQMERIVAALTQTTHASPGATRQERRREAILHGDVPTFMETPHVIKPEHLHRADAAIIGFGYEGITSLSPTRSAPPTVSRPATGSVYWRMGADRAPDAIRHYSLFYSRHHNGGYFPEIDPSLVLHDTISVVDYGNVAVLPEDTDETLRRCSAKVADVVAAGALPVVLGGDHTTPYPVVRAILEQHPGPIGIVVFDAHVDFSYTPGEYWASNQWTQLVVETGKINPANIVEIGIRSSRTSLQERSLAESLGVRIFTVDEVKARGMEAVIQEAIARATDGTNGLYISNDIDCMEPALVPSQKAPEIWGLTIDEFVLALRKLSRENVIGYDVCEMTPDYDLNGMGAQFCARTVVEILAGLAIRKRDATS